MIISYESINRVNPLYFRIIHASRYIEEKNGNKYLIFDSVDVWDEIKNKINDDECDYEKGYMKIKLISDDNLPLNKILKFCLMTIIISCVINDDGKFYPHLFLHDTLYELV